MKFPRRNRELDALFIEARLPSLPEFDGEFTVDMLTVLPSLRRFSHRKLFYSENGKVSGCNVLFRDMKWGHFYLELGVCEDLDSLPVTEINYNRDRNVFITRRIRDYVRCVEQEILYLGRFHYMISGKPRFAGYFSLARKK